MFEKLDHVNWSVLEHAYGTAEDVPEQLRNLASLAPEDREKALSFFWCKVIHQGTVCSATPQTIPFLLEIIESPLGENKAELLAIICAFASASSCPEYSPDQPDTIEQCRREVSKGWCKYLDVLALADESTRCCAALALGHCTEHAAGIVNRLKDHLAHETNPLVSASMLVCIGKLAAAANVDYLTHFARTSSQAVVRFSAALSLAQTLKDKCPDDVLNLLIESLNDPSVVDESYLQLSSSQDESGVALVTAALCTSGLDLKRFIGNIRAGLNGLRASDTASIGITHSLLDYAFPNGQRFAGKLSGIQYAVLELMVESDQIWYWGNVITIFRSFGLADGREDLRQMLGNLRAELADTQDKSPLADTEDK